MFFLTSHREVLNVTVAYRDRFRVLVPPLPAPGHHLSLPVLKSFGRGGGEVTTEMLPTVPT